jgi:hypothetical protein
MTQLRGAKVILAFMTQVEFRSSQLRPEFWFVGDHKHETFNGVQP